MFIACLVLGGWSAPTVEAAQIVEAGVPRAEIVIAAEAPRTVKLAAAELQKYVAKISGATLPIVHEPTAGTAAQVYVGRSSFTDKLGMDATGLEHGAFQMRSFDGKSLVLFGRYRLHASRAVGPQPPRPDPDAGRVGQADRSHLGQLRRTVDAAAV